MTHFDTQGIALDVPRDTAFACIADRNRLPDWTEAFAEVDGRRAVLRTPRGEVTIDLDVIASAGQGTIDWRMAFPDGSVANAYSRLVELDTERCVYTFILTPPPGPLAQLEGALPAQSETLRGELARLKEILEHGA